MNLSKSEKFSTLFNKINSLRYSCIYFSKTPFFDILSPNSSYHFSHLGFDIINQNLSSTLVSDVITV